MCAVGLPVPIPVYCNPKITRRITSDEQITVHENYISNNQSVLNDIALIRFNEPVPLWIDDPSKSSLLVKYFTSFYHFDNGIIL